MTYQGLESAANEATPHLGGNIKVGDPHTYCPSVWSYLLSRFGIESVLDLGSGNGNAALYFYKKGAKVIAVDGFHSNVIKSLYPAILHDLTVGPVSTVVDLVHCQEVVEHIEEAYIENLLQSLMTAKIIVMTHAVPGQQGYHHVNLQPSEYWTSNLGRHGAVFLEEDTKRVRALAERDGAPFMAGTGLVFVNRNRL